MGSGFRTFTAGEVLTASNVQDYLMDQSVMTFADSATRSSAIGTANFEEGMTSYLQDTKLVEVYNGTAWVGVAPAAVTPGLVQIGTAISFSGVTSVSLPANTFSSTYANYKVIFQCESTSAGTGFKLRFRASGSDNTSSLYNTATQFNYSYNGAYFNNASNAANISADIGTSEDNVGCLIVMDFMNPKAASATFVKGLSASKFQNVHFQVHHDSSTSFDSASFIVGTGNATGKVIAYGYNA